MLTIDPEVRICKRSKNTNQYCMLLKKYFLEINRKPLFVYVRTYTHMYTHTHTHTHTYIQTKHQLQIAKAVCELPKMQESQLEKPQFWGQSCIHTDRWLANIGPNPFGTKLYMDLTPFGTKLIFVLHF